jgi:HKD family nuclease
VKTQSAKRLDLPKLLDSGSFDHAVVLTYTFDPIFFEEYCLASFRSLHDCKTISVLLDRCTYDKIVTGALTHRPRQANLRYLLHPVAVPGAFHPKLILLTSAREGRLLVGSANFTRPGLTANAELVGCFDFKLKENETFVPILRSAFAFVQSIAIQWPARALKSNLQEMHLDTLWLDGTGEAPCDVELMTNLKSPLLNQLVSKASAPIKSVSVVSRYFDANTNVLEQLFAKTGARKLKIYTQNRYTNLPPSWLGHSLVKSGKVELYLTDYSSDDRDQPLHGKAFAFDTGKTCLLAYGSANCTTAALLRTARESNVEDLLTLSLSSQDARELVPRLFDPTLKARRLLKPNQLISVPEVPDEESGECTPIRISEAEAQTESILVWLAEPLGRIQLRAQLEFSGGRYVRIPLKVTGSSLLEIKIDSETSRRLSESSTVISIGDSAGTTLSNRVLITNLLDVQTGTNRRKARYVKEAEQNSAGLLSVLYDLRSGDDEDALRTFLTFCDIPLTLGARPGLRLFKGSGDPREEMRSVGQHNFAMALSLHDLALTFCERHFRKLERHVANRHPDGVPNFLHITLAIGGVLEAQIDRALMGLDARNQITPLEWATLRGMCDAYFSTYRDLTTTLWDSYLSKLLREFPLRQIREAFEPELQPLEDLADRMMRFHDRVEKLRTTKCLGAGGQHDKPYGYFQSVLGEQRWPKYAVALKGMHTLIMTSIKPKADSSSA